MAKKSDIAALIPLERIGRLIYYVRGEKVMLDTDLAELYGVSVKAFNQAVKRGITRFPHDFMFRLTLEEFEDITYLAQEKKRGGRRYLPYAFTELGVAMLSTVLHSERAVQVNIMIMRAFVQLRELLSSNKDLVERLEELESKYDKQFREVFDAIKAMMIPDIETKPKREIGFKLKK